MTEQQDKAVPSDADVAIATKQRAKHGDFFTAVVALTKEVERLKEQVEHWANEAGLRADEIERLEATNAAQAGQLAKLEAALRDCKENGGRPSLPPAPTEASRGEE